MTELPSIEAIVEDIEFELLLGIAPAGDVARALAEIRREQNRLRSEYVARRGKVDARDLAGALLRLNDMLLDLLHEVLARLAGVESVIETAAGRLHESTAQDGGAGGGANVAREVRDVERAVATNVPGLRPDVNLDVRPMPVPVAGRLIDRFRLALHSVSLYYVRRLAEQQGNVNVHQADEVERLNGIVCEQQRRLAALEQEVRRQRAQASTNDTDEGPGIESG